MHQIVTCPSCGSEANYIITQGLTITACTTCSQAHILESNAIIRIDAIKLVGQPPVQKELLMIALTAKALYENWHRIIPESM
jgi:hypothetical protein